MEKLIIEYLSNNLSVNVYAEHPEKYEESFVVIEKTGSGRINKINSSTFAFQSYGASLLDAAELNQQVIEAMDGFAELDRVSACRFQRDYNFTDTSTKHYRYQAIFTITHY